MARRLWSGTGFGTHRPNLALATALSALFGQACGAVTSDPASDPVASEHAGSSQGGGSGAGGSHNGGAGGLAIDVVDPSCSNAGLFADQIVTALPAPRVLYSWTTDEQAGELRSGGELFSRSERPGQGRGRLFNELASYAAAGTSSAQQLASVLGEQIFAKIRFAWPNPWATLLGLPGESYGNQLLRIELRPEAWIAYFDVDGLSVFDSEGQRVSTDDALVTPERIGAIYHHAQSDPEHPDCGTFSQGVAFREFALGNLSMVARWSLATPQITERLEQDLAQLERFKAELECERLGDASSWTVQLICGWEFLGLARASSPIEPSSSFANYGMALGLPNELYWPSADNLEALIAALEVSMPSGAPLEVEPGK